MPALTSGTSDRLDADLALGAVVEALSGRKQLRLGHDRIEHAVDEQRPARTVRPVRQQQKMMVERIALSRPRQAE